MAQAPPRNLGRLSEIAQIAARHGFGYVFRLNRLGHLLPGRDGADAGRAGVRAGTATARDARGARADVRQVRPAALDAAGHPPAGHHRRAPRTAGRRAPVHLRGRAADDRGGARAAARAPLRRVRGDADGGGFDRPGAPRAAAERPPRRGQGAAARRAAPDRGRPLAAVPGGRGSPRTASARSTSSTRTSSSTSSHARSARSSTTAWRPATPSSFRRNFAGHPHVRVPRVYWTYTRNRVLTLEYLEGTQVADVDELELTIEERRRLAYLMTEAWMTMIFQHGFFHGDPHPANVLVLDRPDQIGLVDFGLAGKLTDSDIGKATRLFIDAANENVDVLPQAPRRSRRPLPARARGTVRGRAARALLPLLRREALGHRPAPGDPRGLLADLPDPAEAADPLPARSTGRSRRSGRSGSSCTRTSTSSRSRSPTRAA